MEAINSSSFFHYRREKDDFYEIVKEGFHYRYSFEPLGAEFAHSNQLQYTPLMNIVEEGKRIPFRDDYSGIAMPMLCFCDIPIMRAGKHRNNYGEYCIGVDKEMMRQRFAAIINPVFYVSSEVVKMGFENLVTLKRELQPTIDKLEKARKVNIGNISISDILDSLKDKNYLFRLNKRNQYSKLYLSLMYFMALCKPYIGMNYKGEDVCFYEEREWRVFAYDMNTTSWVYDTTSDEFEKSRKDYNEKMKQMGFFKKLISQDDVDKIISHLIVPKEENVPEIINEIMNSPTVFGHHVSEEKKQLIISRVTSFERIEKDY